MGFCLLSICLEIQVLILQKKLLDVNIIFFEELIRLTTLSDAYFFFCVLEFPRLLFFFLAILWNKQTKINNQPLPLGGDASNWRPCYSTIIPTHKNNNSSQPEYETPASAATANDAAKFGIALAQQQRGSLLKNGSNNNNRKRILLVELFRGNIRDILLLQLLWSSLCPLTYKETHHHPVIYLLCVAFGLRGSDDHW